MDQKNTMNNYSNMEKGERITSPVKTPRQIVLTGTIGSGKNNLFVNDACGIASQLNLVGTSSGTVFDVSGQLTIDNVLAFIKSYAIIVSFYNLNSSNQADLSNNLEIITSKLDATYENDFIFSSLTVSNMQFNPDLLNVMYGFVWGPTTALKIAGTESTIYTVTLGIAKVVPYGQLENWLIANPMYKTAK